MSAPVGIAIVGMSCIFPAAPDLRTYWRNIVRRIDATSDAAPGWESETFYDPESVANDRIYCKRGGFLHELACFRPAEYGVMPNAIGGEPDHFLALQVAHEALSDAGYLTRPLDGRRVQVIVGKGTYINSGYTNLLQHGFIIDQTISLLKELHPEHTPEELRAIREKLKESLPPFTPETVPAMVPNIVTGRIANRLNLMGANYTVDAACASSLIAVQHGIQDLRAGRCDMVLAGGVHALTPPQIMMLFCQLGALSRRGQIRPFDEAADGTLLGEGVGMVVLKRQDDAERDRDRVYAIIRGVEAASDGKALGLLAPRVEGEELAIRRAYESTGVSPDSVDLIEAHGTGTTVGDATEIQALTRVFGPRRGTLPTCAIGSVKSMISHLMPAAGIASLIKVALALHHRALPPTLHCDTPNPKLGMGRTRFYVNTELRPWIHGETEPRRAGVNAFGFGGVNAHAVLEEYTGTSTVAPSSMWPGWETELFVVSSGSREGLARRCTDLHRVLEKASNPELQDLAFTLNCRSKEGPQRLAIVASDVADLGAKLRLASERLSSGAADIKDRKGVYFFNEPLSSRGSVAFVFPGEGAQYVGMLSDLCLYFSEVRECFDRSDRRFAEDEKEFRPSQLLFPPPLAEPEFDPRDRLWGPDVAAETVVTADHALFRLFKRLEIRADAMVGHSSGELAALLASGALAVRDESELERLSVGLNRLFGSLADQMPDARLMTVGCSDAELVRMVVRESGGSLHIAMDNCPHQAVISGSDQAINSALEKFQKAGAICSFLPFARGYHTPAFEAVAEPLAAFFRAVEFAVPSVPLYSCATASRVPDDPDAVRRLASEQWSRTVRFREVVLTMYEAGTRLFVEVGPKGNLTGFIADILGKRPHLAIPANVMRHSGTMQLNHALGLLAANGVPMRLDYLYADRAVARDSVESFVSAQVRRPAHEVRLSGELPRLKLRQGFHAEPTSTARAAAAPTPVAAPAMSAPSQVLESHLANVDKLIESQRTVMRAFLGSDGAPALARYTDTDLASRISAASNPFGINITQLALGEHISATCELSLAEDIYLLDHTIGRNPSERNPGLTGLPVMPLTVSLEIMVQVASKLALGKRLLLIENVRAHRWIEMPGSRRTLSMTASRVDADCFDVRINGADGGLLIEGTVVFGVWPPDRPIFRPIRGQETRFPHRPEQYYDIMFHGPLFRSVVSVDRMEETSVEATLQTPRLGSLFRTRSADGMFTDPVLLDGAGQLIGFWAWDRFDSGFTIFPFGFDSLQVYAPFPARHTPVRCYAKIRPLPDGRIHSDIQLCDQSGAMFARITGWKDMRLFDWSRKFARFVLSPEENAFSESLPSGPGVECCRVSECGSGIWARVLGRMILSEPEMEEWDRMPGSELQRRQWLLGRMAAKDAVRRYLRTKLGISLCPADVPILESEAGGTAVDPEFAAASGVPLHISVTHSGGQALALVAESSSNIN